MENGVVALANMALVPFAKLKIKYRRGIPQFKILLEQTFHPGRVARDLSAIWADTRGSGGSGGCQKPLAWGAQAVPWPWAPLQPFQELGLLGWPGERAACQLFGVFGAWGTVSSCGNGALGNAYSVHAAVTFLKALGEEFVWFGNASNISLNLVSLWTREIWTQDEGDKIHLDFWNLASTISKASSKN